MATLFKRILVPHDFSEPASHALRMAADLAARHGGQLLVLHVLAPFYTGVGFPSREEIAWVPPPELLASLRKRLEALVAKQVGGRGAPPVRCRVVMGDPLQSIVEACRRADSIVMSTTGRTGLAHLLVGSVAEKVVRHAPVPVLTVRAPRRRARAGSRAQKGGRARKRSPRRS